MTPQSAKRLAAASLSSQKTPLTIDMVPNQSERQMPAFAVILVLIHLVASGPVWAGPESVSERLASANAAAGKNIFLLCSACHISAPGAASTIGPNLWNVVGRNIASEDGFSYSDSLRKIGGVWDYETLNRYLFDPKSLAPEGSMPFPGLKNGRERADLIAYLRTLSDQPLPLPEVAVVSESDVSSKVDDAEQWQGLPPGPGREDVFYRCRACHSLMIVKQQGLSRESWEESLEWMVEEQGMPPIEDADTRNRVLDYLTTHYGAGD